MDVYYFPIDKIEKSSNVIIYGNGLVGKQLVEWNNKFNYCNILAIIDKKQWINRCIQIFLLSKWKKWNVYKLILIIFL